MGLHTFGYPPEIVDWLATKLNLNVFVEAGTFHGESAVQASRVFQRVITIEKSNLLFNAVKARLLYYNNITCHNGCTRDHVVAHLTEKDTPLFWLDAHWSGGDTAGEKDECPIKDELALIFGLKTSFAILIDDARLFISPPPRPHDKSQWPRIDEIAKLLPNNYAMYIANDVIYVLPGHIANEFSSLLQESTASTLYPANGAKLPSADTKQNLFRRFLAKLFKSNNEIR